MLVPFRFLWAPAEKWMVVPCMHVFLTWISNGVQLIEHRRPAFNYKAIAICFSAMLRFNMMHLLEQQREWLI